MSNLIALQRDCLAHNIKSLPVQHSMDVFVDHIVDLLSQVKSTSEKLESLKQYDFNFMEMLKMRMERRGFYSANRMEGNNP
jgi:hypothetical protein